MFYQIEKVKRLLIVHIHLSISNVFRVKYFIQKYSNELRKDTSNSIITKKFSDFIIKHNKQNITSTFSNIKTLNYMYVVRI